MTETSYFWSEAGIGDYQSSYSDDEFALAMLLLFNYDRTKATIPHQTSASGGQVDLVGTSGANFTCYVPCALVDGRVYTCDATVTLAPGSGDGYYAIVLRKSEAAQTVRAALIYNAGAPPTPTQTAATWEVVIAQGTVTGGVPAITFSTIFDGVIPIPQNLAFPVRGGEDHDDWAYSGGDAQFVENAAIQAGVVSVTPTGSAQTINVNFPEQFRGSGNGQIETIPYVFVTPVNLSGSTPQHSYVIRITSLDKSGFSVRVDDDTNIEAFNWIAVGPQDDWNF